MKKICMVSVLFVIFSFYSHSQSITDSLIVYYPFNGNGLDHSGHGHNAILNGVSLVPDRYGLPDNAYHFDGISNYIQLPNDPELKPGLPITVAFWIKPESLEQAKNHFVATDYNLNAYAGLWVITDYSLLGEVEVSYGGNLGGIGSGYRRSKTTNTVLTTGVWHHIAGVVSGYDDIKIYLDGIEADGTYSGNLNYSIGYSEFPGRIGMGGDNTNAVYLQGTMDEFALWNRALSGSEITQIYNNILAVQNLNSKNTSLLKKVYPNPFNSSTTFEIIPFEGQQHLIFELYDTYGKLLRSNYISSNTFTLDKGNLSAGFYYYSFKDLRNHPLGNGKLVVY